VAEAVTGAGREVGVLPPSLHVRDAALAEALAPELEPRGIAVSVAALPELDDAIRESLKHMADGEPVGMIVAHASWREVEATPREIEAFHAAAAFFYRAAPWETLGDDEPIILSVDGHPFAAAVMGGAGMEFGVALYSDPRDVLDLYENDDEDPSEMLAAMRGHAVTVTFEPRSQLSRTIQRETAAAGWEVAGPKAYPQLYGLRVPGFRITAREARLMTAAMAIIAASVNGEEREALPQSVQDVVDEMDLMMVPLSGDDEEDEEWPWPELDEAHLIGPVGPNADPEAALRHIWSGDDDESAAEPESARLERFRVWMNTQGLSKAAFQRHLRAAEELCLYLAAVRVPAESATEFDLRSFLFDHLPRRVYLPKDLKRKLDDSLHVFVRWLETEEGIGWPWAFVVIAERAEAMELRGEAPDGGFWDEEVKEWRAALWEDLFHRVMLHDRDLPGTAEGWPTLLTPELSRLRSEVQRRWLLWYDEAVRGGTTDLEELLETLSLRQRGWENTPHPRLGGRTPRQAVIEHERDVATGVKTMSEEGTHDITGGRYG